MCSADVASALSMGTLDVGGDMGAAGNLSVDTSGSTFAGTIGGRIKVYVDPYESLASGSGNWYVAGYRGASAYDAGLFYCPYVPLQMVRAVGENDFQQRLRLKHVMEWRIHLRASVSGMSMLMHWHQVQTHTIAERE